MRCDESRLWMGVLLGTSVLLQSGASIAEKPKTAPATTEWQKGKRFAPTRSETYRLCAGTSVQIGANAAVEVQTRIPLPTSVEGLGPFAYTAELTTGRIDIAIDPKQKPASGVLIYGPRHTTMLARGGHVSAIAGPAGLVVGVYDGKEASVGIGSTWKQVSAGKMIVVSAEAPQGVESKLPAVPQHVAVNRPVLAVDGISEPSSAQWDPVANAKRYRVSLVNTETKARRDLESSQPSVALSGLEPGRYELRVAAVEAIGLDSPVSAPAFVNVVGVELPPGAFAAQGKIYLESLQQLTLTHVEGLEATYDQAPVYFKAANRAGLRGKQSTTLYLRLPGATERAAIELLPRALHTQVDISPALARWPRDKVVIRIQVPKLASETPSIELVPSVTVNNQVVELQWVRTEQTLETVIPAPPNYPGPWVLRAEVADQHGIVLGHNFLEIASTAGLEDEDVPREVHRGTIQAQAKR
jgi:hypothetical protein